MEPNICLLVIYIAHFKIKYEKLSFSCVYLYYFYPNLKSPAAGVINGQSRNCKTKSGREFLPCFLITQQCSITSISAGRSWFKYGSECNKYSQLQRNSDPILHQFFLIVTNWTHQGQVMLTVHSKVDYASQRTLEALPSLDPHKIDRISELSKPLKQNPRSLLLFEDPGMTSVTILHPQGLKQLGS